MNLTLSVDEQLVERAREAARQQGSSLQDLVRGYIAQLAGQGGDLSSELERGWKRTDARFARRPAKTAPLSREELYAERAFGAKARR